jgi:hypothetical protein
MNIRFMAKQELETLGLILYEQIRVARPKDSVFNASTQNAREVAGVQAHWFP